MNLVFSSDDRGVDMMAVALYSVIKNNQKHNLSFYIIHSGISKENIKRLKKLETKFNNTSISFIIVDDEKLAEVEMNNNTVTTEAYYRYFTPELLQGESKALYIDFDMLCLEDLGELYSTKLGTNYIGAVPDYVIENDKKIYSSFKSGIGFTNNDKYINSGLLLMNLNAIRSSDIMKTFWHNIHNKRKMIPKRFNIFADQTVTNLTFKGKVKFLDAKYNVFMTVLDEINCKQPVILHFTGSHKPLTYRSENTTAYDEIYYIYYQECISIIGDNDGSFIKNTLKRFSQESKDILQRLRDRENYSIEEGRQLEEARNYIGELENRIAEQAAIIAEKRNTKNILRDLARNFDGRISHTFGDESSNKRGAKKLLHRTLFALYKPLRRSARFTYKKVLKSKARETRK